MDTNILIIEDEIEIQTILKELLIDAGYAANVAGDGLEGITAFRQKRYDLVLIDLMLPKIDGYAVCEMIRKVSDVPVLMLTALDEEDDQLKGSMYWRMIILQNLFQLSWCSNGWRRSCAVRE